MRKAKNTPQDLPAGIKTAAGSAAVKYANRKLSEVAGAVRATGSLDGNLRLAEGADFGGGSFGLLGRRLFKLGLGCIHELDDPEQDKSHKEEVDDRSNEIAVSEGCRIFKLTLA